MRAKPKTRALFEVVLEVVPEVAREHASEVEHEFGALAS